MRLVVVLLILAGACSSAKLGEVTPGLYRLEIAPRADTCTPVRPTSNSASFVSVLPCAESASRGLGVTQAECDTCDGAECAATVRSCERFDCIGEIIRIRGLLFGVPLGEEWMEVDVGPDGERALDVPLAECGSAVLRRHVRVTATDSERVRVTLSDTYAGIGTCTGGNLLVPEADCASTQDLTYALRAPCASPCEVELSTVSGDFECVCP